MAAEQTLHLAARAAEGATASGSSLRTSSLCIPRPIRPAFRRAGRGGGHRGQRLADLAKLPPAAQSASMEYANGDSVYDAKTDQSTRPDGTSHGGLYNEQQDKLPGSLFGGSYKSWGKSEADQQIDFLKQYQPGGTNPPVILNLSLPYNHALTFEKAENGRIYFRDPYGATADPDGTVRDNGVKVEDRTTGLYSVTEEEYKAMITTLHAPQAEVDRFQAPPFSPFRLGRLGPWPLSIFG